MNMNMNRLPGCPTWNHLGVNLPPDKVALPQVPANGWGTAAATAAVPAGIRTNGPETEIFETFTESGMGVAADAFLAANANVKEHLAVGEGAAIETPAVFEVKLDGPTLRADLPDHRRRRGQQPDRRAGAARRCRGRRGRFYLPASAPPRVPM